MLYGKEIIMAHAIYLNKVVPTLNNVMVIDDVIVGYGSRAILTEKYKETCLLHQLLCFPEKFTHQMVLQAVARTIVVDSGGTSYLYFMDCIHKWSPHSNIPNVRETLILHIGQRHIRVRKNWHD